ncbi:TPA: hypothetical protein QDB15_001132 [Burkholderia vietnamiensis]|uniref:hypothetical protein n=1 Tax=Burkholderia vietnamiensis TaxID=60552 RepID=UPI001589EB43|nr:hypothetical protein [Burkholderia vietnamiensis]MCA8210357.1 hypothetical protein [Burkholderia vietnamiensis]HDR9075912.1 hypothetical protein [Burkholderia vietnamiensis]HDR9100030.1 hypothetical protein [Burkholderia vietnamiensis]HDR9117385.1 hypothetical protein [Burkholderia vietnamiensis]
MLAKAIIGALICAVLSACVHMGESSYARKMNDLTQWAQQQKSEIDAGRKTRSVFYAEYYERVSAPPSGPMDVVLMRESQRMIGISKQYEDHQISFEDLRSEQRISEIRIREQNDRVAQAATESDQQRRAAALAVMGSGMLNRPAYQAQPYQMPMSPAPVTTNCQRYGTTTNCISY